ncbi:CPBP family intramembrane glutamic endopeptidase [Bifidobacterium simiarum]|nr:CPBP family intramembrane glutamic endopeptidase [Bifidobacterium simiarum]
MPGPVPGSVPAPGVPKEINGMQPAQIDEKGRAFPTVNLRWARKAFSRLGWAVLTLLLVTNVAAAIFVEGLDAVLPGLTDNGSVQLLLSALPQYLIALPITLAILNTLRPMPPQPVADDPDAHPGVGRYLSFFVMGVPIMFVGSLVGSLLSDALSAGQGSNALDDVASDNSTGGIILQFVVFVVLAPLVEEYVFRKQILDRTRVYGEGLAIVFSALIFGLMHANFYQFFYAFGWGLLWGYVYLRTGHVRYTIGLHALVNFLGGIVTPMMIDGLNSVPWTLIEVGTHAERQAALREHWPMMVALAVYFLAMIAMFVGGVVLLIIRRRRFVLRAAEQELLPANRARVAFGNAGVVTFVVITALLMVLTPVVAGLAAY